MQGRADIAGWLRNLRRHTVETTSHDDDHSSSHTLAHSQKRDIPSREVGHQLGSAPPRQAQRHTTHDTPVTASCQHQPSSARTSIGGSADAMVAPSSNFSLDSSDIIAMPRAVATRQVLEAARRHCTTQRTSRIRNQVAARTKHLSRQCLQLDAMLCTKLAYRRARAGNRHGALAARRCGCIACGCCISILNQQGRTPGTQSRVVCPPDDCASAGLLLWHPHDSPER